MPGDFPTVQAAVYAKANGGAICLGAQTFAEDVKLDVALSGPLTIVGAGQATIVRSLLVEDNNTLFLSNLKVAGSPTGAYGVYLGQSSTSTSTATAVLSQVDVMSASGSAVSLGPWCQQRVAFAALNSYLHDSYWGLYAIANAGNCTNQATATITLINTTITKNNYGVDVVGDDGLKNSFSGSVTIQNSLFVNNAYAAIEASAPVFSLGGVFQATWTCGHNAFFGNGATYAIPHGLSSCPEDITADPQLDTSTSPPTPKGTSPLKGAADASVLPAIDFFGHSRTSADSGAVNAQ